jgi:EAL and modified HD-GYP domain-containing signal transduction protein
MQDFFLGRQPIFNRDLNIFAYELLFRRSKVEAADVSDGDQATADVVVSAFVDLGLDRVAGDAYAFINCTRAFMISDEHLPFPQGRVVFEVLEDVEPTPETLKGLRSLVDQGYRIAIDDYTFCGERDELLELAHIVKVDIPKVDCEGLAEKVANLHAKGIKVLAEKVETPDDFDFCRSAGFDYFQGYFLSRPKVIKGRRLAANRLGVLQLLAKLQDPDVSVEEVTHILSEDVTLSYRILRLVNSAFFGLPRKVESIHQAVVYLGLSVIKNWSALLITSGVEDKPRELLKTATVRAQMCRNIAIALGDENPDLYFTVGLFSTLDALMDLPLEEVLEQLPLSDSVIGALLRREGSAGRALTWTLAYEGWRWGDIAREEIDPQILSDAYLEALAWADQTVSTLE